ncbi:hypothetical protein WKI68_24665 [Streptomyces sp. MS1.HAVA.3]|uniref:Uncharacterized protein n=1 Tax=Streptomyces caledonius TaxID=3134107 RepID=A0ABU8U7N9_9ACTN
MKDPSAVNSRRPRITVGAWGGFGFGVGPSPPPPYAWAETAGVSSWPENAITAAREARRTRRRPRERWEVAGFWITSCASFPVGGRSRRGGRGNAGPNGPRAHRTLPGHGPHPDGPLLGPRR